MKTPRWKFNLDCLRYLQAEDMGTRYTKAIIMLVVGFPILMAGVVIDKALENDSGTPRQSTITIARLMMATGAIMVTVGIFFCCTITLNKKEKVRTPRTLPTSIRDAEPPQLTVPLQLQVPQPQHSTPKRKTPHSSSGVRLLSYSPTSGNNNIPLNIEKSLSVAQTNNPQAAASPPLHTGNTPTSSNRDTGQFSSTSSSTHEIVQYPSTSGIQKVRKHKNSSAAQNAAQNPRKSSATHRISQYRSTSVTEIISQHSSTTSTQNISLHSSSSGIQHAIQHPTPSAENITYQVSSGDMAKLLMAAKKTMDQKSFEEITRSYQIVFLASPGRQAPDPLVKLEISSKVSSDDEMSKSSKSSSSTRKHRPKKVDVLEEVSIPVCESPSAPPYQGSSPEIEPPPYSP